MKRNEMTLSTNGKVLIKCDVNAEHVTIPNGVEYIENEAFANCRKLRRVVIPESVTEIGISAFSNCTALISIILPENLKKIGKYAFSDCKELVQIVIPKNIEEIEEGTFNKCIKLKSILFTGITKKIGKHAFLSCCNLKQINYVHDFSRCTIGPQAFSNTRFNGETSTNGNEIVFFRRKNTEPVRGKFYVRKDDIELWQNPLNVFSDENYEEGDAFYKAEIINETDETYSLLILYRLLGTGLINEFNLGAHNESSVIKDLIERMFCELKPLEISNLLHEIDFLESNISYESTHSKRLVSKIQNALFSNLSISCEIDESDKVCILKHLGNELVIKGYKDIGNLKGNVLVRRLQKYLQNNDESFELFQKNF